MSRRELKNLAIDGADALITGYLEDIPSLVYYWRGDYYEHDGSAESAYWAQQGALAKRLGPHYFHLEGIVADRTVDDQKQYLAHWSKYHERTWEPASFFNTADIAAYEEAAHAGPGSAEMVAANGFAPDLPEMQEGLSDSAASLTDTVAPLTLDSRSKDATMVDVQQSIKSNTRREHSTMLARDNLADESTQNSGNESDDDEEQDCNDVLGSGLVDEHGEALRCTSHLHKGKPVQCCDTCRNEALNMLTEEQRRSLEQGADMALCYVCGEAAIDSDAAFECKCSKLDQCGVCLLEIAEKLVKARSALNHGVEDGRCGGCSGELDEERVSSCAACGGLKVRWSIS
ncbi:hypothetical protein KC343_g588 [Hortaea werneckii]|nr:hypothetical protein KC352_g17186 [Hortaea werneckii]KAI7572626.1 hypothetical protein KC317_g588 [Hortaea werneckii]KAI7627855.1 hypothetical protein KC346_g523 [Hortaea werneckii]KAI7637661.1 hypothetical protein KC343_g588 [Hortaea werneckii]KAI7682801.1 hypothetical protein KC319_g812 [Hortaea werneckii]